MSREPHILLVIPTKNRRASLAHAVESVRAQAYKEWRIVIVNDGSTDDTAAYLDSLRDPRITIIHYERSRGVNAARNAAYQMLGPDEWAVPLDDDDALLPDALSKIADAITQTHGSIPVLFFNTVIRTPQGERMGGRQIGDDEPWHDLTYAEIMTRWGRRGDGHIAMSASLFPQYLFPEDVNGFESEAFMRMSRDGVRIRYFPAQTLLIDRSHDAGHLSKTAARKDPASFKRVYQRIFRDHAQFFREEPRVAMERAKSAAKVAARALDPLAVLYFGSWYFSSLVRFYFAKRMPEKPER